MHNIPAAARGADRRETRAGFPLRIEPGWIILYIGKIFILKNQGDVHAV
jgi:hypothetical protein